MMDSAFYLVSGILALGLFALIARNLWRLDRRERDLTTPKPPEAPDEAQRGGAAGELPPLPMDKDGDSERRIAPPGITGRFFARSRQTARPTTPGSPAARAPTH